MKYYSLATAYCTFTFTGIPTFTASFSASASDKIKEVAIKLSKKTVLKNIKEYVKTQPYLIEKTIKIKYYVKRIKDSSCGCN